MRRYAARHEECKPEIKRLSFCFGKNPRLKGDHVKKSLDVEFGNTHGTPKASWNELSYRRYY